MQKDIFYMVMILVFIVLILTGCTQTNQEDKVTQLEREIAEKDAELSAYQSNSGSQGAEVRGNVEQAEETPPGPEVIILQHKVITRGDSKYVIGEVKNVGKSTVGYIDAKLILTLYDQDNSIVGSKTQYLDEMKPGQTLPFEIMLYDIKEPFTDYTIQVV